MNKKNRIKSIEEIYDNMQEKIYTDICNDEELKLLWNQLSEIERDLTDNLSMLDSKIFDEYLSKEAEVLDCERKKSFAYGFNLSNKLIIGPLRK